MKKTIFTLLMLAVSMPALAVEEAEVKPAGIRAKVREEVMEKREEIKNTRLETREKISVKRDEIQKVREENKEKIGDAREEIKKNREQGKKDLKAKLAKVKDTKKREAVERINDNIAKLNDQRTDHYVDVLSKVSDLLNKVEERSNRAAAKGVDVTTTKTAIASARQSITDATASVKTQSEKVYTLAVTDEATLKQKVGEVRKQLQDDLSKLHDVVKSAKEAVRKAATTLAKTPRVEDAPETVVPVATTTVNQ
jgi:hypothetical protein